MTTNETDLLTLILAETRRVESLSPHRDWERDAVAEWVKRSSAIDDLKCGLGVRVSGHWLGKDSASRKARQRGLEALEWSGLVELHAAWGERRTHVRLTAAGRQAAERLNAERVPHQQPGI